MKNGTAKTWTMLSEQQVSALKTLRDALGAANDCGALDDLAAGFSNPDTVNDFCDAVVGALETQ